MRSTWARQQRQEPGGVSVEAQTLRYERGRALIGCVGRGGEGNLEMDDMLIALQDVWEP